MSGSGIAPVVEELYHLRREASENEKNQAKLRRKLETFLNEQKTDRLEVGCYRVTRQKRSRDSIDRERLPAELWNKYKKSSEYTTLSVTKKDD